MATANAGLAAARRRGGRRSRDSTPDASARGARRVAAQALGAVSLGVIIGLVLAIVLAAAERPSFLSPFTSAGYFPSWMAGPLAGLLPSLTHDDGTLRELSSGAIGVLFVSYLVALRFVPCLRARWLFAAIALVQVILFCAPPLFSTDVFNYLNYGRMGAVYHLNPYTVIPQLEPHNDPTFAISNWHQLLSPYGPLFTLLTYAVEPLGVATSFWMTKAVIGLAFAGTLMLVWRCAALLGRPRRAAMVLVGLNPLVLIWGLGADHNDPLMMLLVMLALYLALLARQASTAGSTAGSGRSWRTWSPADRLAAASGVALVTAVSIKASAAVLLPFLLLGARRRATTVGAAAAALVLGLISLAAFGANLPDVATQGRLVTPLGLANVIGVLLGLGGETSGLHTVLDVTVIVVVLGAILVTLRFPERALAAAFVSLLALICSLTWLAAWYVLWVLPFAALLRARSARVAALLLTAYLLLAFAPNLPLVHRPLSLPLYTTALGREHTDQINALLH